MKPLPSEGVHVEVGELRPQEVTAEKVLVSGVLEAGFESLTLCLYQAFGSELDCSAISSHSISFNNFTIVHLTISLIKIFRWKRAKEMAFCSAAQFY